MISIPGKIPILISPFFWVLILLIGWLNTSTVVGTAIWAIVILFSVLIHEYGHALTALAFGQKAEINLVGLGGLTRRSGHQIKKWQDFLIVLNGPLAGFALYFAAYYLSPYIDNERFKYFAYALKVAANVNFFWNVLNLLPILPLDGGQLMRIGLEALFGFKGIRFAFLLSIILSVLVSLLLFFIQAVLGGALFLMLAFESYRAWSDLGNVSSQDSNSYLQDLLREAQEDIQNQKDNEALSKLLLIREQAKEGVLFVLATELIARLLAKQGHIKQAYEWLLPIEKRLSPDYLFFLQQLAFKLQEWEKVISIGNKAYQLDPSPDIALLNAFSFAIIGQPIPTVGWLKSAVHSGLRNIHEVIRKREFDSVRQSQEFQSFLKTLT